MDIAVFQPHELPVALGAIRAIEPVPGPEHDRFIEVIARQAGFVRNDGFMFLFFGIAQFHLGLRITPIAEAETGKLDVDKVMVALARGAACNEDLSDGFNLWRHAERSLEEVRAELGVPALEVAAP